MKRIVVFALVLNAALLGVIAHQLVAIAGGGAVPTADRNGDVNGDARLDMSDAIYLLLHIFRDGPGPVALADSPEVLERLDDLETALAELHWAPDFTYASTFIEPDWDLVRLPGANLQGLEFWNASLRYADLRRADLSGADIENGDLEGANLQGAILQNTIFLGAILALAQMQQADLRQANLMGAALWRANLREANLSGVNLSRASLIQADLTGADLTGADLTGTQVQMADFRDAIGVNFEGTIGTPAFMPND